MVKPAPYDMAKLATEAAYYQEMLGTPGWDVYSGYMEKEEADAVEKFLQGNDPAYARGYIAALRFARDYPATIVAAFHQKER